MQDNPDVSNLSIHDLSTRPAGLHILYNLGVLLYYYYLLRTAAQRLN